MVGVDVLSEYPYLLWPFMVLTSYFDSLFAIGLLVFAEPAFITAGALAVSQFSAWPIVIVMMSSWCGELTSYFLGRRFGQSIAYRFIRYLKWRRRWQKIKRLLQHKTTLTIVASRFMGPATWITPFIAGSMKITFYRYALSSLLATMLGVGQFCLYGAVGLSGLAYILPFLAQVEQMILTHWPLILPLTLGLFVLKSVMARYRQIN